MVNQSQLENVQRLLRSSPYLSAAEREEWSSLLAFMNDKQLSEFASILQSKESAGTPSGPVAVVPQLKAPPVELDLPVGQEEAHKESVPAPQAVAVEAGPANASKNNSVSAFINRNFAATLHRTPPEPVSVTESPLGAVIKAPASTGLVEPQVSAKPILPAQETADIGIKKIPITVSVRAPLTTPSQPQHEATEKPVWQQSTGSQELNTVQKVSEMGLNTEDLEDVPLMEVQEEVVQSPKGLDDIRKLNVATLRARGVMTLQAELIGLCTKYGYFSVQFALEHSPLYQTYLAIGSRVLKEHKSFEAVEEALSTSGRPYLTKPEFEEVNDLLQRIKAG